MYNSSLLSIYRMVYVAAFLHTGIYNIMLFFPAQKNYRR